ncbi:MAG: hypothetical protein KF845_03675 [Cyclobacteriaceae bacterium]|nr:hypothetical protein [Cyclobacteriaceae bacterium]
MNLWVKRTGQLFLAALFLMACEDESVFLGFKGNSKFTVKYQEFLVGDGAVVGIDPELTDNATGSRRLLVGEHDDPIVGNIRTEAFAEFLPVLTSKLAQKEDHTYVYDSITIQLRLDGYSYGLTNANYASGKFTIRRITDTEPLNIREEYHPIPGTDKEVLVNVSKRYYSNSTVSYADEAESLGETRFAQIFMFDGEERHTTTSITRETLEQSDTLVIRARLDDDFGLELFNVALDNYNEELSDFTKFRARFKGLALIPDGCNTVLGLDPANTFSLIKLYYHSELSGEVADTLTHDFGFSGVGFHNINPSRTTDLPPAEPTYIAGEATGSLRVIQAGYPMVTKIDLTNFYEEFADEITEKNLIINSAELIIESVNTTGEYNPLSVLELRLMEEDNSFKDYRTLEQSVRDSLGQFFVFTDLRNYFVSSDLSAQSTTRVAGSLLYNSTNKNYTGSITLFVQNLFENKNSQHKLLYLGLYPGTSITGINTMLPTGKTLDRTVFMKENIKLKVHFTQPNNSNL